MSAPRVENMKQLLRDATPEQREELERIARTAADMVEGFNRFADTLKPGLRKGLGWMESPEGKALMAHFEGLALLVETFNDLQSNPVIQGSPMAADFVRNVINEFDNVSFITDPSDALASVQAPKIAEKAIQDGAANAANARWEATGGLKTRVIAEMKKHETPKNWKNPAAKKAASLAVEWNEELRDTETKRTPYTWPDQAAAFKTIRRWLDN